MKNSLFIIYVLITGCINSQEGFRSRIYLPGAPDHKSKAIFEISPGNYIAAGFAADTTGWPQEINRLTIMRLDSTGALKWSKQYGSFSFFYYNNFLTIRSYYQHNNHIYFSGCIRDSITSRTIGVFIKFDYNGDTLWRRIYRDPDPQEDVIPQMVTASVDGGFLLTGFFQHWGNHTQQGLLIKTDANGKELWRKKISKAPPNVQDGKAIIQDSASKKIVIAGYKYPYSNSNHHNVLVLDSLGNQLHSGNFGIGHPLDMIQGKDGYCYITGYRPEVDQFGTNYSTPFVARFSIDTPSYFIWYKEYKPKSMTSGFGEIREIQGGLLLGGWLDTIETHVGFRNVHARFIKIDYLGNKLFDRMYNYKTNGPLSHNSLGPQCTELTSDGGWVAAIQLSNNQRPNPFFFVKYDSTGCDSTAIYCQSVITGALPGTDGSRMNFDVFPNPAGTAINLLIQTELRNDCRFSITDLTGKVVLLNEHHIEKTVDVSGLQNGVYFVNLLQNGKAVRTKKLVIQR